MVSRALEVLWVSEPDLVVTEVITEVLGDARDGGGSEAGDDGR